MIYFIYCLCIDCVRHNGGVCYKFQGSFYRGFSSIYFTVTAGLANEHLLHQGIRYKVVRYLGLTRLFFPLSLLPT